MRGSQFALLLLLAAALEAQSAKTPVFRSFANGEELRTSAAALQAGAAGVLLVEREGVLMHVSFRTDR